MGALVQRMRSEAPEAVGPLESALAEWREREALMKRSWSDTAFEEGEVGSGLEVGSQAVGLAGGQRPHLGAAARSP